MLKTDSILLLVSGSIREPNGLRALGLANQFRLQGKKVGIYLLQNAVLSNVVEEAKILIEAQMDSRIDFYCSKEDLTMRGLAAKDLHPKIRIPDYSYLIDLMMEKYGKVIGVF